ncbi:hypothetical protein G7Y89_g4725 [Cudoniella acicularis]|uniref:Heterokaryon incompatibility domain-containing protein n=1 Tax=Cudoniella acicularis TaxID=354080 RepID=A0A8H4W407_9HELO|nr:hypothetical protein G7Y89_g4725 [Cudoniella acicularis]
MLKKGEVSNHEFGVAKNWLKECVDKHDHCGQAGSQVLPTRLLCLRENRIYLIHTVQNPGTQLQYATLSHCWGAIDFFKLCQDNFQDLQECVPEKELTGTFRDAVYVTRYLGLEYLWIDSICIIQDDEQDWEREPALMSGVYGGSTINIAAANSLDGNGGCLYNDTDHAATIAKCKAFRYRFRMPGLQEDKIWELAPMVQYSRLGWFLFDFDTGSGGDDERLHYQTILEKQKRLTPLSEYSKTLEWSKKYPE